MLGPRKRRKHNKGGAGRESTGETASPIPLAMLSTLLRQTLEGVVRRDER